MKIYKIAIRNISRNKRRSVLSGSAITISVAAIVFLFGLMGGMLSDMTSNIFTYMTGAVRVRHADFDRYERLNPMHLAIPRYKEVLAAIQANPSVEALSPRINFPGRIPIGGIGSDEKVNLMGIGVDFVLETRYQDYEQTLVEGRLPEMGTREALIGKAMARKINIGLGDKVTVLSPSGSRGSNAFTFTIVGVLSLPVTGLESRMLQIPLDTAQRFLWLPEQVHEILIKTDSKGDSPEALTEFLKTDLTSDVPLGVQSYKDISQMAAAIEIGVRSYDLIALIFFLLASTVIINTTTMVIFERMNEIGTLGAMGMTGKQLVKLFFFESLFICVVGALIGLLIGIVIIGYLGVEGFTGLSRALEGMDTEMAVGSVIYPVLNFKSTVLVFIYAFAVTAIATWWPSRRAAKITPVEALRHV